MSRVRIGSVRYLNAIPLVEPLGEEPGLVLTFDTPAGIAGALERGELDLGLVPVVEAARQRLFALPDVGVVGRGAVRSVLLLSRVPLAAVRMLALDPASRTSAALVRLLLRRRHGSVPTCREGPATGDPVPPPFDAGLVIGDRALALPANGLLRTDLSEEWHALTGLPFVFALWAGPDRQLLRDLRSLLAAAADAALADIPRLAKREAAGRGLSPEMVASYLREAIHYRLGEDERRGLSLFLDGLREEGLLPADVRLRFTD